MVRKAEDEIGIGLVGSGFMGKAHALAFRAVGGIFPLARAPRLEMLADVTAAQAERAAAAFGFARSTGEWQALVEDPAVELVAIAAPNRLHAPIALAAIAAGKHVYCEKPLATTLEDARAMTRAAAAASVVTMVGFNYLRNPMIQTARAMIRDGEIGTVTGYRGIFAEGFMADPATPFTWRCRPDEAGGAMADIGSHAIAMARYLLGEVESVCGRLDTIHDARPAPDGTTRLPVSVDDQMQALLRFRDRPFTASLSASWLACGRDNHLAFEVTGTHGAILFDQERFNELRVYRKGAAAGRSGFTTLRSGGAHGEYAAFCPADGHQLGFNDLKAIEVAQLLEAVAGGRQPESGFPDALAVTAVMEAIRASSAGGGWVRPDDGDLILR